MFLLSILIDSLPYVKDSYGIIPSNLSLIFILTLLKNTLKKTFYDLFILVYLEHNYDL